MCRATRNLRAELHLSCRQWTRLKTRISTILHPTSRGLHSAGEHWNAWFRNLVLELAIPSLLHSDSFREWVREACRREARRLQSQNAIKQEDGITKNIATVHPTRVAPRAMAARHLSDRVQHARNTVGRVKSEHDSLASNTAGLLHESKVQPPHNKVKSEPDSDPGSNRQLPRTQDTPLRVKHEYEAMGFGPVSGYNHPRGGGHISWVVNSRAGPDRQKRAYRDWAPRRPTRQENERDWGM